MISPAFSVSRLFRKLKKPLFITVLLCSGCTAGPDEFREKAERGDIQAQYELGLRFETGSGVEKDPAKAVYWYTRAAERGHARSLYNLGCMYQAGEGIERDYRKALGYYRKAADLKLPEAMNSTGRMYDMGLGVGENNLVAVEYFKRGADLLDPESMLSLGLMYAQGEGVPRDMVTAFMWFETALHFASEPFGNKALIPGINHVMKQLEHKLTEVERSNAKRGSANWIESRRTRETVIPPY